MELDPSGKHISLGGDLDGCEMFSQGFEGVQSYPTLADRLAERGLEKTTIRGIFWNNALNVFRSVEKK